MGFGSLGISAGTSEKREAQQDRIILKAAFGFSLHTGQLGGRRDDTRWRSPSSERAEAGTVGAREATRKARQAGDHPSVLPPALSWLHPCSGQGPARRAGAGSQSL